MWENLLQRKAHPQFTRYWSNNASIVNDYCTRDCACTFGVSPNVVMNVSQAALEVLADALKIPIFRRRASA